MREYLYGIATDKSRGLVPALIRPLLSLLSVIYGLGVRFLAFFYGLKRRSLGCRVVSVGNITLGGTGKTPLVEYIAKYLKSQGHKAAIITRGYKRLGSRFSVLGSRTSTEHRTPNTEFMGDEPCMLAGNLRDIPVVVDKDRVKGAKRAIEACNADTVILDDGFQQWRIRKDLEILTIDCTQPFGNTRLLPRGILREPLSSLKRADIFVLTKTNLKPDFQELKDFLTGINPCAGIFESAHNPAGFYKLGFRRELSGVDELKGKEAALISGIGDPGSFENLISSLGINIGLSFRFPDHHNYSQKEVENIIGRAQAKKIDTLITTEKDAVRLSSVNCQLSTVELLVLRIELKITKDEEGFRNRLLKLYSA